MLTIQTLFSWSQSPLIIICVWYWEHEPTKLPYLDTLLLWQHQTASGVEALDWWGRWDNQIYPQAVLWTQHCIRQELHHHATFKKQELTFGEMNSLADVTCTELSKQNYTHFIQQILMRPSAMWLAVFHQTAIACPTNIKLQRKQFTWVFWGQMHSSPLLFALLVGTCD